MLSAFAMVPRVLLVDDHVEMMAAIERLLGRECEVVGRVSDADDVLDAATSLRPTIIVLDINMPKRSGLDLCREITHALPGTKVILLTAEADAALVPFALAAGAAAYVNKYSAAEELPATVKRICGAG